MRTIYTPEELEALSGQIADVLDGITPPVQIVIVAALLLASIRAAKEMPPPVPSDVLALEGPLDEMLSAGIPAVTMPLGERVSDALKARMH